MRRQNGRWHSGFECHDRGDEETRNTGEQRNIPPQWPRFTSMANSGIALTHPATISAVAMPVGPKCGKKRIGERDVHRHRNGSEDHRCAGVFAGKKTGNERLDRYERGQAETVDGQNIGNDERGIGLNLPRSNRSRTIGSDMTSRAAAAGSVRNKVNSTEQFLKVRRFFHVPAARRVTDSGRSTVATAMPTTPSRKLIDAVRIDRRRYRAFHAGCDIGVDEQVDLRDAAGDRCGQCLLREAVDVRGQTWTAEADLDTCIAHGDPHNGKLDQTCSHHAPRRP